MLSNSLDPFGMKYCTEQDMDRFINDFVWLAVHCCPRPVHSSSTHLRD